MKKIITLLAVATGFAVMAPAASQAHDSRSPHSHGSSSSRSFSHSCRTCGTGVYRERAIVGRARDGCAIYGWRTVAHSCRPSFGHGHGRSHGGRPGAHISLPGVHIDLGRSGHRH
ncbi:MAG: hypothetical protein ACO1TE_29770 [Prosthecobacter sp.]